MEGGEVGWPGLSLGVGAGEGLGEGEVGDGAVAGEIAVVEGVAALMIDGDEVGGACEGEGDVAAEVDFDLFDGDFVCDDEGL